jgi:putative heme degradation protein
VADAATATAAAAAAAAAAVDAAAVLPAAWAALEVRHFKAFLKRQGLPVSGTKAILSERARAALGPAAQ